MKRFFQLISCVALMAFATTSFAQTGVNAKMERASDLTTSFTTALNLSQEQANTFKTMAVNFYNEIDVLSKDTETFEMKKKELENSYLLKLKEILSKEQIEKLEQMQRDEIKIKEAEKK
jgi:hypothetical protein